MATHRENIPQELKVRAQWVCWRYVDKGGPKPTKVPYQTDGQPAAVDNLATWTTFECALAASTRFDGIGFVLTPDLGIVGFDLDGCVDDASNIAPWAANIVARLDTYTEISPSGHGLRLLAYGKLPPAGRKHGPFECYSEGRYLTFTGNVFGGPKPIAERQEAIDAIHREQFPCVYEPKPPKTSKTTTPTNLDDASVLRKAMSAKNGESFQRLWNGDTSGYGSHSEADLALCSSLAYWTGDVGRTDALFRQSGLMREKWDERHGAQTYGAMTIGKALDGRRDTYSPNGKAHDSGPDVPDPDEMSNEGSHFALTELSALLAEPAEAKQWVWEEVLPAGGFSIVSAKPKVGKSTLARNLALAVARGEPFLGRATSPGPVVYLALEEKRSEVADHFRRMGATDEPVLIHTGAAPEEALAALRVAVIETKAVLAIVDTLFRLVRIRDGNDYAEVTRALEPVLILARETGCHILAVHHDGKVEREGGDSILGSTAIFGSVDTAVTMRRREDTRTVQSSQRYGKDIPKTALAFDENTGLLTAAGTVEELDLARARQEVREAIGREPMTEAQVKEAVGGDTRWTQKAIRSLVTDGGLVRTGSGKKGDPYCYSARQNAHLPISSNRGNEGNEQSEDEEVVL